MCALCRLAGGYYRKFLLETRLSASQLRLCDWGRRGTLCVGDTTGIVALRDHGSAYCNIIPHWEQRTGRRHRTSRIGALKLQAAWHACCRCCRCAGAGARLTGPGQQDGCMTEPVWSCPAFSGIWVLLHHALSTPAHVFAVALWNDCVRWLDLLLLPGDGRLPVQ